MDGAENVIMIPGAAISSRGRLVPGMGVGSGSKSTSSSEAGEAGRPFAALLVMASCTLARCKGAGVSGTVPVGNIPVPDGVFVKIGVVRRLGSGTVMGDEWMTRRLEEHEVVRVIGPNMGTSAGDASKLRQMDGVPLTGVRGASTIADGSSSLRLELL